MHTIFRKKILASSSTYLLNLATFFFSFRELGTYSWHTVGLLDPAGTPQTHSDICQSFFDASSEQRRICMRGQRILTVTHFVI